MWVSNPHHPELFLHSVDKLSVATQCCCCKLISKSKDPCCLLPACFWGGTFDLATM